MKYRSKTEPFFEFEAVQFVGSSYDGLNPKNYFTTCPEWLDDLFKTNNIGYLQSSMTFLLFSGNDRLTVNKSDWIAYLTHEFKSFRIAVQDDKKFKRDYEEVKYDGE